MTNTINKPASFWSFLKDNTIQIPIIQRDYAQGRPDKSYIREAFLRNIVDALKNSKRLKLDFIYSAECGSNLLPLDGQQRLTTLWLLHWYIALRANKLTEENAEIFKKFSYQTRASSEDFCRKLCQIENFMQYKSDKNLFEYISKSKWFYSYWMQDPTIQSMLVMLCGQSGKSETKDNIVKVFEEDKIEDFEKYWDILVSKNCSILFYHLTLSQFGLSDDLYIKMNARGKSLTAFENFKADLVNFLKDKAKDNPYLKEEYLSPSDGIPLKFDTNWMDVFWESRSKSHRVDEIYNSFLNRFFFNEYLISIKTDEDENNNKNKNTLHLHTFVINDVNCSYQGLDPFFKNVNPCELFINLNQVLDRYQSNLSEVVNKYFDKYTFIPSYDKDKNSNDKVIEITQAERVVFLRFVNT